MALIEVSHLTKRWRNDRLALDDVSFEVRQGEILGLTGKSGSGKSSLMKCIYRTYLVNSGEIVLTTASRPTTTPPRPPPTINPSRNSSAPFP